MICLISLKLLRRMPQTISNVNRDNNLAIQVVSSKIMVSVPTYEIVVDLVVLETQCEWKVLNRWHVIDLKMSAWIYLKQQFFGHLRRRRKRLVIFLRSRNSLEFGVPCTTWESPFRTVRSAITAFTSNRPCYKLWRQWCWSGRIHPTHNDATLKIQVYFPGLHSSQHWSSFRFSRRSNNWIDCYPRLYVIVSIARQLLTKTTRWLFHGISKWNKWHHPL